MTTVTIDEKKRIRRKLFGNLGRHPQMTHSADDNLLLPFPEDELISQEEFKKHFEKRLYERLGLKITL
jgi:hypothetical protein